MKPPFASYTKTWHNDTYPALAPTGRAMGKTVIITGASGGIGRATAVSFAKAGATKIALLGRRQEALQETRRLVLATKSQTQTSIHICDSADADTLAMAAKAIGFWDVVVLNAGIAPDASPVQHADPTVWWTAFETNVKGAFITTQAFLSYANLGRSTEFPPTILSVNAALPFTPNFPIWHGKSAYNSSKIALAQLMQHLAHENRAINIVSVHPGVIDTDMLTATEEQKTYMKSNGLIDSHYLPADFFVWLSTPEAGRACTGKLVFANWDVDELMKNLRDEKDSSEVLTIKLEGWPFDTT